MLNAFSADLSGKFTKLALTKRSYVFKFDGFGSSVKMLNDYVADNIFDKVTVNILASIALPPLLSI